MPMFYYRSFIIVFVLHCEKFNLVFFYCDVKNREKSVRSQVHVGYRPIRNQELQGFVAYMNFYLQLKASALRKAQKQNQ